MTPSTPPPHPRLLLDERCDRIVASLTQRLAHVTRRAREEASAHDFLVPLLRPDLLEPGDRAAHES